MQCQYTVYGYCIYFSEIESSFHVKRKKSENEVSRDYTIGRNQHVICTEKYCQVRCQKCSTDFATSPCAHKFTCTCEFYSLHNICRHIHVVIAHLTQLPTTDEHDYAIPEPEMDIEFETVSQPLQFDNLDQDEKEEKNEMIDLLNSIIGKLESVKLNPECHKAWIETEGKKFHDSIPCGGFPKLEKRKRVREPVQGFFPKPQKSKKFKKPQEISGLEKMLQQAMSTNIDEHPWPALLSGNQNIIMCAISKLSFEEKDILIEKYSQAKDIWKCNICFDYKLPDMESGYVECTNCILWCHQSCAKVNEEEINDDWYCSSCRENDNQ